MPVCQQVACRGRVDGPCQGRGPTLAERNAGGIGRENGIRQGGKSRTKATLAPQPSGSPELPGRTHQAGGGGEDAQQLGPAAGLSPGPISLGPASLRFPQLPTTLSEAGRLVRGATGVLCHLGGRREGGGRSCRLRQGGSWSRSRGRAGGGRRAEPDGTLYIPGVTLLFATVSLQNGNSRAFRVLKLVIESNWGKPEYTCIYRVQVYGKTVGTTTISQMPAETSPQ